MVGTVERDRLEMLAPVTELLAELPVREGQAVAAVTVVARLDDCNACAFCERHCPDFAIDVVRHQGKV